VAQAADSFVEESRPSITTGYRLGVTGVISPTEQNVRITVHRKLPNERGRLQVVFEGSQAFNVRLEELDNGTFCAVVLEALKSEVNGCFLTGTRSFQVCRL
jgi:hypothetical protein